jgi:pSer/pThr/pTyr-binding forkhead associated (FHA) protein
MRTLKLSVVEGPDVPTSVTFQGESLSIGRVKTSDFPLTDSQVSRKHAEIVREGPDFVLVDLGGANGTFVGPERKKIARHTLVDGDRIRIGRNVLEVAITLPRDEDATELRVAPDPDVTATLLRPRGASVVLTVLSGPDRGKVFSADKNRIEIGRRPGCDVVLSDAGVSRLHATIRRDGGRYMIYDENSANGIERPGSPEKVSFAEVHDGMVLRFSETEVEIRLGGAQGVVVASAISVTTRR